MTPSKHDIIKFYIIMSEPMTMNILWCSRLQIEKSFESNMCFGLLEFHTQIVVLKSIDRYQWFDNFVHRGSIDFIINTYSLNPWKTSVSKWSHKIQFTGTLHYCGVHREVAMKYTPPKSSVCEKYSYLNAINRPEVEAYGIPAVYYYGQWQEYKEKYHLLAIILLVLEFIQRSKDRKVSDVDLLILARGFVS